MCYTWQDVQTIWSYGSSIKLSWRSIHTYYSCLTTLIDPWSQVIEPDDGISTVGRYRYLRFSKTKVPVDASSLETWSRDSRSGRGLLPKVVVPVPSRHGGYITPTTLHLGDLLRYETQSSSWWSVHTGWGTRRWPRSGGLRWYLERERWTWVSTVPPTGTVWLGWP